MWCHNCQQDMPGFAHATSGRIVCSRCHQPMRMKKATHAVGISDGGIALDEAATAAACGGPPKFDNWQMRARSRMLSRELHRPAAGPVRPFEQTPTDPRRFDPPVDLLDDGPRDGTYADSDSAESHRSAGGQLLSWLIVIVGLLALCTGLAGIVWSLTSQQTEYWNLALSLTLAGQGTLIFGLVLVVWRLWRSSRYATDKLQDVHSRLAQLQRDAYESRIQRSGSSAFQANAAGVPNRRFAFY